jgi:hypothetical protein
MSNKALAITVVFVIGLSVSTYFVVQAMKPEAPKNTGDTPPDKDEKTVIDTVKDTVKQILVKQEDNTFPLKMGKRGDNVRAWQQWLLSKKLQLPKYGADGIFGKETEAETLKVLGKAEVTEKEFNEYTTGAKKLPIPYADDANGWGTRI